MSFCRREGKDTILFATKEDHEKPSSVQIPEPELGPGIFMPDGSINWGCPCLGGMPTGPCGVEFREAVQCTFNSIAKPDEGGNCSGAWQDVENCMAKYPKLYDLGNSKIDDFRMEDGEVTPPSIDNKGIDNSKSDSKAEKK